MADPAAKSAAAASVAQPETQLGGEPFLFGFGFDAEGHATPLTWAGVLHGDHLHYKRTWLHLNRHSHQTNGWLIRKSGLDRLTAQALLQEDTRPRATRHGSGFLINLRGVNLNPGEALEDMLSLRMWASETLLITMRSRRIQSARDVAEMVQEGMAPNSTGGLVAALANSLTERMEPGITAFDEEADRYEDELLDPKIRLSRSVLPEFRRRVLQVRRYIIPQREALTQLVRDGATSGLFSEQDIQFLRESTERVTRLCELIENIRERSTVLQEEVIQESTEETNKRLFVLSILSAVFMPISFVTGLFGVNLAGMPGAQNAGGFWMLSGSLVCVTAGTLLALRWKKWI